MSYALATIWHERSRFLPAILAVAFSAVLIAVQSGLLIGLLSMMSTPVDLASADLWVADSGVQCVDQGSPIPINFRNRIATQPEVVAIEEVNLGYGKWILPAGDGRENTLSSAILIIGARLDSESLAA